VTQKLQEVQAINVAVSSNLTEAISTTKKRQEELGHARSLLKEKDETIATLRAQNLKLEMELTTAKV
jgi:hypothetical protein